MALRTLAIVNPESSGGTTKRRFERATAKLRDALGPFDVEWTRGRGDAERIAREAVRAGVEQLVIVGGDGTTSEVATGLLSAGLGGHAALAPLPFGTGSDWVRTLGIPRELDGALEAIASGRRSRVDAGRVEYQDRAGSARERYFLNVTSVGISARIDEIVDSQPKQLGGFASFLLGTVRALATFAPVPVRLTLDGVVVHEGRLTIAAIANGCWFGGGMRIAPGARLDDGLLDLVVVPDFRRARLLYELPRLYTGTHVEVDGVVSVRGRVLEAEPLGPDACPLEIDGEPLGVLPARIEMLPGAIQVVGAGSDPA